MPLDRRDFVRSLTAAGLVAQTRAGAAQTRASDTTSTPAAAPPPVTRTLARYLVTARFDDLPQPVRAEAARTLLNWVGSALGGSRHETMDIAVSALGPFSGPAQASVLGR